MLIEGVSPLIIRQNDLCIDPRCGGLHFLSFFVFLFTCLKIFFIFFILT